MSRLSVATVTAMREQQAHHRLLCERVRLDPTLSPEARQMAWEYLDRAVENFQIAILCRGRAIRNRAIEGANCALRLVEDILAIAR